MNRIELSEETTKLTLNFQEVLIPIFKEDDSLNLAALSITFLSLCRSLNITPKNIKDILQTMFEFYRDKYEE